MPVTFPKKTSHSMQRLLGMQIDAAEAAANAAYTRHWREEEIPKLLGRMEGKEKDIGPILQSVFAQVVANQDLPPEQRRFVPALELNGPQSSLEPHVRELLEEYCSALNSRGNLIQIRAEVVERENEQGELWLGVESLTSGRPKSPWSYNG